MISPHTPPGTKVQVVEDPWSYEYPFSLFGFELPIFKREKSNAHEIGMVLTLETVEPSDEAESGFWAMFRDYDEKMCLSVLRSLDPPESPTSILKRAPAPSDLVEA